MKAYKIEFLVFDPNHPNQSLEAFLCEFENMKFVNPIFISSKEFEIGEWHDEHPLNYKDGWKDY
jgi:hypothetical protein